MEWMLLRRVDVVKECGHSQRVWTWSIGEECTWSSGLNVVNESGHG
jgi:hypothetical protein